MLRRHCLWMLLSLGLTGLLHGLVERRWSEADFEEGRIRGDAVHYLSMARGASDAPAPFRYRVGMPAIARALPLSPPAALELTTLVSLFLSAWVFMATSARAGIDTLSAFLAITAAFVSAPVLYAFYNPWLVDGGGLLGLFVGMWCLTTARWHLFLGFALVFAFVREGFAFLAPAWISMGRRAAVLACAIAAFAYLFVRLLVDQDLRTFATQVVAAPPAQAWRAVGDALAAWHVLWLLALVGLWSLSPAVGRPLRWAALFLLVGAVVSTRFATDTTRMMALVAPAISFGLAAVFAQLQPRHRGACLALICLLLVGAVLWVPIQGVPQLPRTAAQIGRGVFFVLSSGIAAWLIWAALGRNRTA